MLWAHSCVIHSTGKPGIIIQVSFPCQVEGQGSSYSIGIAVLTASVSLLDELWLRKESSSVGQALVLAHWGCGL